MASRSFQWGQGKHHIYEPRVDILRRNPPSIYESPFILEMGIAHPGRVMSMEKYEKNDAIISWCLPFGLIHWQSVQDDYGWDVGKVLEPLNEERVLAFLFGYRNIPSIHEWQDDKSSSFHFKLGTYDVSMEDWATITKMIDHEIYVLLKLRM